MEELDPEWAVGVGPQRMVGAKAQRPVLVPGQARQLRRALVAGGVVRLGREVARKGLEPVPVERLGRAEGGLGQQLGRPAEHLRQ